MEFKNPNRHKAEFDKLNLWNKPLQRIIIDLDVWCFARFKKNIVITMIDRTQAEQDDIYKNDPKYIAKPFKSPHQMWCAVDIRSSIFTPEEIKQIVDYLNNMWNTSNGFAWTAKCHTVPGQAEHFHIQFVKK